MKSEPTRITLCVELKEELYQHMKDFLADNSDCNQEQLMDSSLSLFLENNSQKNQPEDYEALAEAIYLQSVS